MFESITYETLLKRMLDQVSNNVDKREGSIIYDALAPAAAELKNAYIQLDVILNETFADTASRTYLIKRAAERGIVPYEATQAILKGEFNTDIPIGHRFSLDTLNYTAIEKMETGVYKMQCETAGRIGNSKTGNLIPIDYIKGLTFARLTELLVPGEDEEDTEYLRKRYYDSLDTKAFGGNIQDYKGKVSTISGVGGVKVYPAWNGGGSVKLVLINSEYQKPSSELISIVQTEIDPIQNQGKGLGIAPIGHIVTVEGVKESVIPISTAITYQDGWEWNDVKDYVFETVDQYLTELAQDWADSDTVIVRVSQIETRLLNIPGILDISKTAINGEEKNLVLDADSIPKRGEFAG
ncbi:baseplate J/gp47 family protein [Sinanaerobacter sp. ZZT-01]|uniref:baseplate J/gp47 family protein n=1 Tax=Sinanaerobacter sp. ZZT-01 TaxID=3111540 RepID=UPI002D785FD9|nr:baseplate J/gp47 family protein [Sinanaerobacter sp. ZZT-01]WRR94084.1 baseplate J/gp47 family protein [Sinanaerobacter sp. ZZT-01]